VSRVDSARSAGRPVGISSTEHVETIYYCQWLDRRLHAAVVTAVGGCSGLHIDVVTVLSQLLLTLLRSLEGSNTSMG